MTRERRLSGRLYLFMVSVMSSKITKGDLGRREEGVGNVNDAMVRERAAQLAVLDGRQESEVTQADFDRAEEEIRAHLRGPTEQREVTQFDSASLQPDDAVGTTGREAAKPPYDTRQSDAEELVRQGIEEAVHDDMVESGKET